MKIAYIIYQGALISGRSNGVRAQAETWACLLRAMGHHVDLINPWGNYDWKSYDVIHLFGACFDLARGLHSYCPNIHWSPITDPPLGFNFRRSNLKQTLNRLSKDKLFSGVNDKVNAAPYIAHISVRTNFEKEHLMRTLHLPESKFVLVPLSISPTCQPYTPTEKEPFCLHISSIYQERKNILRLVEAANKYDFRLVLAGNKGTEMQFRPIKEAIGGNKNIEVLGFISEEKKQDLYKRAKVFCLPSLMEGVGIVALDAAFYGAEIVITDIPGPKEYYGGKCIEVNPLSVDDIGRACIDALQGRISYQPELASHINNTYSGEAISKVLVMSYTTE